jgi:hypothetical protein
MKFDCLRKNFEKYSNIKFNETPSNNCSTLADGQTDMTELVFIFRNFSKAPKNSEIVLPVTMICLVKFKPQEVPNKRKFFCVCAALTCTVCQECILVGI